MLNLKQVLESVKSNFNSKNRKRLAGNLIRYHLSLLLFFVAFTGVILVGCMTDPEQLSPVPARQNYDLTTPEQLSPVPARQNDPLTTRQLLEGARVPIPHEQGWIFLKCDESTDSSYPVNRPAPIPQNFPVYGPAPTPQSAPAPGNVNVPAPGNVNVPAPGNVNVPAPGNVGAGVLVRSTRNGEWQDWSRIHYGGTTTIWAEDNGWYAIQPINANGEMIASPIEGEFKYEA